MSIYALQAFWEAVCVSGKTSIDIIRKACQPHLSTILHADLREDGVSHSRGWLEDLAESAYDTQATADGQAEPELHEEEDDSLSLLHVLHQCQVFQTLVINTNGHLEPVGHLSSIQGGSVIFGESHLIDDNLGGDYSPA